MRRVALIALLSLPLGSCEFAVKHPAVTAGIVVGSIGMGTCELGTQDQHLTCAELSSGAGVALALVVVLAMWLGYEDEPATANNPNEPGADPANLPPAPVFVPTPDQTSTVDAAPPPPPPPPPTIDAAPPADAP